MRHGGSLLAAGARACLIGFVLAAAPKVCAAVDLSRAVVVAPADLSRREAKAVAMLVDEVQKRTGIDLAVADAWPQEGRPAIAVGPAKSLGKFGGPFAHALVGDPAGKPEGFRVQSGAAGVVVAGNDERGVLFGVGYLLRQLRMARGRVELADGLAVDTAPAYPLRGHQLGYRPKTNSYDAWDLPQWEQYYRDLAVFGANAVELIPPRSDDARTSPHFPRPPLEMMEGMSRLADEYGLDVWIWYPAMDASYADPQTVAAALDEWSEVYRSLPRLDAIFVPGGDPGHTQPKYLMSLLEKQTQRLHQFHPQAQMWVSPQGFTAEWMAEFYEILRGEPKWLAGIVFGPQVRVSLPELRQAVPARYPIRHYPDITHSRQCQYPVPGWDVAHAVTSSREAINPRPVGQAVIFRATQPFTIGFLTYSEGCNDDVNKAVWSGLGWNPETPVIDILREFGRYFIGAAEADGFAQGLLALERNWQGALATNEGVYTTLAQFQDLERRASPQLLGNWRFQQALYRAYYDAYVRARLLAATAVEERALEALRSARSQGASAAIDAAQKILAEADAPVAADWRKRVFELADAMFKSIQMQTSVSKYQAISIDRGATLDTVDVPLGNGPWLKERLAALGDVSVESERLEAIARIVDWTNPGPGGFYDDLGKPGQQPHLVPGPGFERDPGSWESPRSGFAGFGPMRWSWKDHAEAIVDGTLRMHYDGLDPEGLYKLRVTYGGDGSEKPIRCVANGSVEIHPYIKKKRPIGPVEFDIPQAATRGGQLDLAWQGPQGIGGNGRNVQVSEVWLMKREAAGERQQRE